MSFKRGDFVRISGLKGRTDLNGLEGAITKKVKLRFEVDVEGVTSSFLLKPCNLTRLGQSCVVIGPCDKGISSEDLPIYTSYLEGPSEYQEIQELKSR